MPDYSGPLGELDRTLRRLAGDNTAEKIMSGSDELGKSPKPESVALWVKDAMSRMDKLLDTETRTRVMVSCGHNCASLNRRPIEMALKRRNKYDTVEEFLTAESRKPPKGTDLVIDGDSLLYSYKPQTYGQGMRCYCSLLRGLPMDETASETFCNCSKGFVETYWSTVLEKPVKVDLLESAVSGSSECKFRVTPVTSSP